MNGMIDDVQYVIYSSNIEHENMSPIVLIVILQAKATDRRDREAEATEGKRHRKGMLYTNTPYA